MAEHRDNIGINEDIQRVPPLSGLNRRCVCGAQWVQHDEGPWKCPNEVESGDTNGR